MMPASCSASELRWALTHRDGGGIVAPADSLPAIAFPVR